MDFHKMNTADQERGCDHHPEVPLRFHPVSNHPNVTAVLSNRSVVLVLEHYINDIIPYTLFCAWSLSRLVSFTHLHVRLGFTCVAVGSAESSVLLTVECSLVQLTSVQGSIRLWWRVHCPQIGILINGAAANVLARVFWWTCYHILVLIAILCFLSF